MPGNESALSFKRIWQSLLVQLACQALFLVGLVGGDAVASATGSYDVGYGTTLVITVAAFVARVMSWVEIVAALSSLKEVNEHFSHATCWYLASFCLTFAYFVTHSIANTLQASGMEGLALQSADQVVSTLKDTTPLIAFAQLIEGYAEYLDSLGEPTSHLGSLRRIRTFLVATALLEATFSIPSVILGVIAPDSMAYGILSLLLALVYAFGLFAQVVGTAKARSVWKTIEEMLG